MYFFSSRCSLTFFISFFLNVSWGVGFELWMSINLCTLSVDCYHRVLVITLISKHHRDFVFLYITFKFHCFTYLYVIFRVKRNLYIIITCRLYPWFLRKTEFAYCYHLEIISMFFLLYSTFSRSFFRFVMVLCTSFYLLEPPGNSLTRD